MNISRYAHQTVLEVPLPRLRGKEAIRLTGLLYDLAATLEDYYRDAIAQREELKEQVAKVGSSRRATVTRPWRRGSGSAAPWSTLKRRSINRTGSPRIQLVRYGRSRQRKRSGRPERKQYRGFQ